MLPGILLVLLCAIASAGELTVADASFGPVLSGPQQVRSDRFVVIAFWGRGCAECLYAIPELSAIVRHHPRAAVVAAHASDGSVQEIRDAWTANGGSDQVSVVASAKVGDLERPPLPRCLLFDAGKLILDAKGPWDIRRRLDLLEPPDITSEDRFATYWHHDLNPFAVPPFMIPGTAVRFPGVRWYGLAYVTGVILGALWLRRWCRIGRLPLVPEQVIDFATFMALGIIAGGRLGYCLFYDPELFITFSSSLPWWGVFYFHDGGMASHGGLVGMVIAWFWWCRRNRVSMPVMADASAAVVGIGVALGRIANFINGELWGRPTDVSWAVVFPDAPLVASENVPRHPSQLYAVGLEGVLVLVVAVTAHRLHRSPGLTTAAALLTYGLGRFIGEFFREPDKGQPGGVDGGAFILGFMSKGQALTIPLFLAGVVVLWWAWKRGPRPDLYQLTPSSRETA